MAAAVSQLCVRQGSTLLDCFIQHKGCKFISNIYIHQRGYYWQNQPNSLKVKGYQEVNSNVKQLLH